MIAMVVDIGAKLVHNFSYYGGDFGDFKLCTRRRKRKGSQNNSADEAHVEGYLFVKVQWE